MRIIDNLKDGYEILKKNNISSYKIDCEILMSQTLSISREEVLLNLHEEKSLNSMQNKIDYKTFIAMRCWKPRASEVIKDIINFGPNEMILLPLYPQFSYSTSGSSINEWKDVCKKNKYNIKTSTIFSSES